MQRGINVKLKKRIIGFQDCYSRSLLKQHAHVSAVLLAYALTQVKTEKRNLKIPEEAVRQLRKEKDNHSAYRLDGLDQLFREHLA